VSYGMNWHDGSTERDTAQKIERAVQFYLSVYFAPPTLVLVNPAMLTEGPMQLENINVRASNSLAPNSMWPGATS
jgi:hypothetical protein